MPTINKKTNIKTKKNVNKKISKEPKKNSFLSFIEEFTRALVITSVIILLSISFIIVGSGKQSNTDTNNNLIVKSYLDNLKDITIIDKGENFFGKLNLNNNVSEPNSLSSREIAVSQSAYGAGDISTAVSNSKIAPIDSRVLKYNYKYKGENFLLFPSEVQVYKKVNPDLSKELVGDLKNKDISLLNINNLNNIGINNMTIFEDRDYGYYFYLGLIDGSFSIYKNWDRWPISNSIVACDSKGLCSSDNGLTVEDIPSDEKILEISNKFLADYGVSVKNYGLGEVQKSWFNNYLLSSAKTYIPETMTVVYPLMIDGLTVYEQSGNKYGLTVEIDIREKKVSGVYNLMYQYFESSSYTTENNIENVIIKAEQGGLYPDYYYGDQSQVDNLDINIESASLGLVRTWQYDNNTRTSFELYVPAYIFPITTETSSIYKENIVVPALEDFFSDNISNDIIAL
ncbi:MAG: hypothetical protein WCX15_01050 [Bacilli bacterium]|jgi:hypothetical protein